MYRGDEGSINNNNNNDNNDNNNDNNIAFARFGRVQSFLRYGEIHRADRTTVTHEKIFTNSYERARPSLRKRGKQFESRF